MKTSEIFMSLNSFKYFQPHHFRILTHKIHFDNKSLFAGLEGIKREGEEEEDGKREEGGTEKNVGQEGQLTNPRFWVAWPEHIPVVGRLRGHRAPLRLPAAKEPSGP